MTEVAEGGQAAPRRPGPPVSRADYVHTVLHREILDGALQPGAPLRQSEIATRLGVSITPVREALRRLESVGLVSYEAHRGATVTRSQSASSDELYLLRAAVEGLAARLAARRITPAQLDELSEIHRQMQAARLAHDVGALAAGSRRFHATIADIGGPSYVGPYISWVWNKWAVTPVSDTIWQFDDVVDVAMADHQALLEALRGRDSVTAGYLMTKHLKQEMTLRDGQSPA